MNAAYRLRRNRLLRLLVAQLVVCGLSTWHATHGRSGWWYLAAALFGVGAFGTLSQLQAHRRAYSSAGLLYDTISEHTDDRNHP